MPRLKQWTARVLSRIDWAVTQIENHESQVTSALKHVQQASARARVQLGRVEQDGKRLRRELSQQQDAAEAWRKRALALADEIKAAEKHELGEEDPAKPGVQERTDQQAIECLRRSRFASKRARELEDRVAEHQVIEARLRLDLGEVEKRITALREQRNLLRTRQSRAEALSSAQTALGHGGLDLDDLFDRWETSVTEVEMNGAVSPSVDAFEHGILEMEEEAELRDELEALRSGRA